jgi:hypothetical protein
VDSSAVDSSALSNRGKAALIRSVRQLGRAISTALEGERTPRTPQPRHPLSAMSCCHMGFDRSSEAVANAVGAKCISYIACNLRSCPVVQGSNCCCDRGC